MDIQVLRWLALFLTNSLQFLPLDVMQVSVRPSVSWITSKRIDIFEIFAPSGSNTILVFPSQRGTDIRLTGTPPPPLTGASNARGYDKITIFFTNISLYLRNGNSQMGTCSEIICKHRNLFPSMQHLAWLPQGRHQEKPKCGKNSDFWTYALT